MDRSALQRVRTCAGSSAGSSGGDRASSRPAGGDDPAAKETFCRRFGRALRRARCARGWSQEVLAARADLSVQHVQRLEAAGRRGCYDVKATSLLALLRAFGVAPQHAVEQLLRPFEALAAQLAGDDGGPS